jgi:hypothetical protein
MECPNCEGMMHYDGEMWECFECGETLVEDREFCDEDGIDWQQDETLS